VSRLRKRVQYLRSLVVGSWSATMAMARTTPWRLRISSSSSFAGTKRLPKRVRSFFISRSAHSFANGL